ncbi:hypothetical protein [Levilactobacillus tujiorum]|uniref:Uncharacterized protein n=1 Tax=Levilactobacillus tujiorum TaxID=2912243 RepID=A0ABX1L8K0_9LACO|nr:hypothetical protein [Levilactobacillus tujiorum]MCH5465610.1 hypothetical protein [Levilactobacillus tujiorum]NLR12691.1 hypothetical protein [Lactobacillus sp. HBUAS51387]NLR30589.1 hypothetical protein [Levilactobacillus tujiorum]
MNKKDKKLLGRFESKKVRNKVIEGIDLPEDVPLFIKFVDRKYLSDFLQQGILHFGTLAEYRDMAQPGGVYGKADTIIGDLNEGVFHREYGEGTILDIDNKRTILEPHEYSTLWIEVNI